MKIAIVLGTRPEILKFYSVIKELEKRNVEHKVYFTSQHFSKEMGENFFKELGINISDSYSGKYTFEKAIEWCSKKLSEYQPDVVLVQGDTNSALAGAISASQLGIPIGHIEAGLRTWNFSEPFPEEYNRTMIDSVSKYHFCPTTKSFSNITRDHNGLQYFITGNTIIDLVREICSDDPIKKEKLVIITSHRRENWDKIKDICEAVKIVSKKMKGYKFVFVRHANKRLAEEIEEYLKDSSVIIENPLPYKQFIKLIEKASFIISDSGGVVEEASYLMTPVAILRNITERPEAIDAGLAQLVGNENAEKIADNIIKLTKNYTIGDQFVYGDGYAAQKIVNILVKK